MIRLLGTSKNEITPVESAEREAEGGGRHVQIVAHRQPGEADVDPVDIR
jgi:hypothetical protein